MLQCTMCTLGSLSSSQPNKLRHILKFLSWYPIQHIFVPACSIARNSYKKMFLWTSNSKSVIFSKMYPSVQWTLGYIFGMLTVYPTWATKYSVSHRGYFRHWGTWLSNVHIVQWGVPTPSPINPGENPVGCSSSCYQAHTWPEIWMVGQKWRAGELPYSNSTSNICLYL